LAVNRLLVLGLGLGTILDGGLEGEDLLLHDIHSLHIGMEVMHYLLGIGVGVLCLLSKRSESKVLLLGRVVRHGDQRGTKGLGKGGVESAMSRTGHTEQGKKGNRSGNRNNDSKTMI
jgi:hypothetical protein